jgi:hypothetical protein
MGAVVILSARDPLVARVVRFSDDALRRRRGTARSPAKRVCVTEPADPAGGAGLADQADEDVTQQRVQSVTVRDRQRRQCVLEHAGAAVGHDPSQFIPVGGDRHLPDGTTLGDAVRQVDDVAPPDWYGVNCAHPTHVRPALDGGSWQQRLRVLRPNASTMTHEELDPHERPTSSGAAQPVAPPTSRPASTPIARERLGCR